MTQARFSVDGTNNASISGPLSATTGSGYKLAVDPLGFSGSQLYSTAQKYEGSASAKLSGYGFLAAADTGGTPVNDNAGTLWVDALVYVTAAPSALMPIVGGFNFTGAGAAITTDLRFAIVDNSGANQGQTSANLVPLNEWFRVSVRFSTSGVQQVLLYLGANIPDGGGAASNLSYNCGAAGVAGVVGGWDGSSTVYFDDVIVADTTPSRTYSTTHSAAAALSTTATLTATAAVTRPAAAAISTTSAVTATAAVTRPAAAAISTTATISASMTVTSAGISADAALSTTSAIAATVNVTRPAAAALSTALSISASLTVGGESGTTTVGYLRGVELAGATLRSPATNPTDAPTLGALVNIDTVTLTAVVSTSVTPSRYGVSVFVGGSVDPITAGLLPSGSAYVWFASDGIHVQEAT
jgi:hypothetical protein